VTALATFARAADERGVASLWVSDGHPGPRHPRRAAGCRPRVSTIARTSAANILLLERTSEPLRVCHLT
jgi:alkanesulfonate monooxygenase SsuD/methylene tetrahydromethanopterin reductase-like flavin-dependent oxidoreductase (luciferase family)